MTTVEYTTTLTRPSEQTEQPLTEEQPKYTVEVPKPEFAEVDFMPEAPQAVDETRPVVHTTEDEVTTVEYTTTLRRVPEQPERTEYSMEFPAPEQAEVDFVQSPAPLETVISGNVIAKKTTVSTVELTTVKPEEKQFPKPEFAEVDFTVEQPVEESPTQVRSEEVRSTVEYVTTTTETTEQQPPEEEFARPEIAEVEYFQQKPIEERPTNAQSEEKVTTVEYITILVRVPEQPEQPKQPKQPEKTVESVEYTLNFPAPEMAEVDFIPVPLFEAPSTSEEIVTRKTVTTVRMITVI